ncbi:MAG: hypothetical protein WCW78_00305 [Candidatus Paceibacterota bacterium]|jgi:hypothetical protein
MREFGRNEDKIFETITIDQGFKKAKKFLDEAAIKPRSFADLYGEDSVKEDELYVEKMEAEFERGHSSETREVQKLATIFEAIVHDNADMSEWFGSGAEAIKPPRFDDIKNGVDTIVEIQEDERSASHLGLAIDATFSQDMEKKFTRIRKEIDGGQLAKVKYFQSEHLSIRGELSNLPRVIIGVDAKTIKELNELWLEGKKRELGKHPVQFQILEEIIMQLEGFRRYAEERNQKELAIIYGSTRSLIADILSKKHHEIHDTGERDQVYYAIQSNLSAF